MVAYRLYCLDGGGHISLAEWIDASGDAEAVEKARLVKNGALKCEVWHRDRLVVTLDDRDLAD